MEELIQELSEIKGVRNVKKRNESVLKINLHSREIPGQEAEEIMGDLRKISPKISNTLDDSEEISGWNWIQKPKKQYTETGLKTGNVNDRKAAGHRPPYYTLSVQE